MRKETAIAAIIVAAVLGFVGGYLVSGYTPSTTEAERPGRGGTFDSSIVPLGESPLRGAPDAPVTAVYFTDVRDTQALEALEGVLEDDDLASDVRLAIKVLPARGQASRRAAAAAYFAAERGQFWETVYGGLHEAGSAQEIDRVLEEAGLDVSAFDEAFDAGRYDSVIEADLNLARSLGVDRAPAVFINGQHLTDLSSLELAVQSERGAAAALVEAGVSGSHVYALRVRGNAEPSQMVARRGDGERGEGRGGAAERPRAERVRDLAGREGLDREERRIDRRREREVERERPEERPTPEREARAPREVEPPSDDVERLRVPIGDSYVKGPEDALVTIVEFSDFHCPFCGRVNPTLETLFEEYGSDIRLSFKHNPLPMHPESPAASQAALAAGAQGKFWEMHDLIFANQRTARTREQLVGLAEQLGLDIDEFTAFLDEERGSEQIEADQALASRVGARGTPHFFINGRRLRGAQPVDAFRQIIDEELALARQMMEEGVERGEIYTRLMADAQERAAAPQQRPTEPTRVEPPPIGDSPTAGPDDAPVTIFIFSEFQCPYCGRARPTVERIQEEYGERVRLVFKSFPLPFHNNAALAAQAALAAHEQGKFWEYHDILFENQRALSRPDLERYAEQIGLDMQQFNEALDSNRFQEQVERETAEGRRAGVSGTPTFIVNGERVVGALPFERFQPVIERALEN